MSQSKSQEHRSPAAGALGTPTDLSAAGTREISGAMNAILADVYALYVKTKNFHWHLSGPQVRDYHLLFDEQADQIFAMADPIAERVRKVGGTTLRSIGHIARLKRVSDNDAEYVEPSDMLAELREDNKALAARHVQAGLSFEFLQNIFYYTIIHICSTKLSISRGAFDLEYSTAHFHNRNIKCSATKVKY
jgi:starvation-inducible DNA-binding protein